MEKIISVIKNPSRIGLKLLRMFGWMLSDRMFLKIQFRLKMGYPLNLDNPQTYNEKLQWLKLYNRRPEYTKMVDKYEVKKYVASIIGEEHIIPTLGLWDRFEGPIAQSICSENHQRRRRWRRGCMQRQSNA